MDLDSLLSQYEHGSLSRRELLAALTLLVTTPAAAAATQGAAKPIGAVKAMNHVTCFVPDVSKSVGFYQGLFGMPILTRQDPGINLSTGNGFFGIYPTQAPITRSDESRRCATMYGLMKMPEPMMPPMTIITASNNPSARLNG
jgi:hypothetical protein